MLRGRLSTRCFWKCVELLFWNQLSFLDTIGSQTAACYQWGVCRRVKRHSFALSLSTPDTRRAAALLHKKRKTGASSKPLKLSVWTERFQLVSPVSGLISSSSFTMPSPCMAVQCLMGEPPPILLYCSWIFGVRRLAMNGPSLLQSQRQLKELHSSTTLKGQY